MRINKYIYNSHYSHFRLQYKSVFFWWYLNCAKYIYLYTLLVFISQTQKKFPLYKCHHQCLTCHHHLLRLNLLPKCIYIMDIYGERCTNPTVIFFFIVRPVSTVKESSVTDNLKGRYYTIYSGTCHSQEMVWYLSLKLSVTEDGRKKPV